MLKNTCRWLHCARRRSKTSMWPWVTRKCDISVGSRRVHPGLKNSTWVCRVGGARVLEYMKNTMHWQIAKMINFNVLNEWVFVEDMLMAHLGTFVSLKFLQNSPLWGAIAIPHDREAVHGLRQIQVLQICLTWLTTELVKNWRSKLLELRLNLWNKVADHQCSFDNVGLFKKASKTLIFVKEKKY